MNNRLNDIVVEKMRRCDVCEAVALVGVSMNADEAGFALDTMKAYFDGLEHGICTGRAYYVYKDGGKVQGLVGLHHYSWGPRENVWLSWFAVDPAMQGRGVGKAMMAFIEDEAREKGYKKLFVETYEGAGFEKAHRFYAGVGFEQVGRVDGYLSDGAAMVVYGKGLC